MTQTSSTLRIPAAVKPAVKAIAAEMPLTKTALIDLVAQHVRALKATGVAITNAKLLPIAEVAVAKARAEADRKARLAKLLAAALRKAAVAVMTEGVAIEEAVATANASKANADMATVTKAAVEREIRALRKLAKDRAAAFQLIAREIKTNRIQRVHTGEKYDEGIAIAVGSYTAAEVLALIKSALPYLGRWTENGPGGAACRFHYNRTASLIDVDPALQQVLYRIFESEWDDRKGRGRKSTTLYIAEVSPVTGLASKFEAGNGVLLRSIRRGLAKGIRPFDTWLNS